MAINVFEFENYRLWLNKIVYEPNAPRGIQSRLAEAAECQKSYLSLILQEKVHLSPDQLLKISLYLKMQDTETDYVLELLARDKAASQELRERINQKLKEIRRVHERLESRFETDIHSDKIDDIVYHSSWHYGAIHMLVSIPTLKTPERISKHLNLDINLVKKILGDLQQMEFIEQEKGYFNITKKNIHLPRNSPFFQMSHTGWRLQAISDVELRNPDSLHYTSLHTLSITDFNRFKELLLELISQSRKLVAPSKDEVLICLAMDFFEVKS
jgi:uncharacterized protein (TIGR02147 family)